jgi:hypothetical protein
MRIGCLEPGQSPGAQMNAHDGAQYGPVSDTVAIQLRQLCQDLADVPWRGRPQKRLLLRANPQAGIQFRTAGTQWGPNSGPTHGLAPSGISYGSITPSTSEDCLPGPEPRPLPLAS